MRKNLYSLKKRRTDCHSRLCGFAMTDKRKYICTPYVFIIAKRLVILSAEHERIRNTLRGETDCRAPCGVRNNSFFLQNEIAV